MSSGSFASLSSSEDDDIPQSKIINTSTASFHLQMENSDSGSDEGSKTVEDTSIQEKGPSESPLRKKQRNALLAPLDLSTPSVQFMPGACGGPADIDTPTSVIRRRTSTPISFNTSTAHNYVNMESVNELMKKMMDSQTEILMKTLTDQGEKIEELHQLLRRIDLHAGTQRKGNKTAIHVPAHIKQAVRDAYRHSTAENNLVWTCKTAAGSILKYSSGENKELSEAICVYVKGQYPTTEEGVIKTGIETYFNTIKQRRQMEEDGKKASHNRKMVLYGRKNRKLQNRVKALQAKKLPVSEEDKLMKAMKIDFMSSEDSDSEDETRLITRPLTWLSKDFKSYMDKLDSKYQRQLNAQGKKLRSKRVVGRPSERPCPKKSPDLAWVFA
ncbi:uncharacterized protein LOC127708419 [Mytilus californianus]|uniref:uncharacterized protein LOC127708419 n=1 Tax=Mytilus californianus TaxID=6549 RepID=UPI002247A6BE|nr:uncharacterized protein LOC127708419 [Mytilus californianus]